MVEAAWRWWWRNVASELNGGGSPATMPLEGGPSKHQWVTTELSVYSVWKEVDGSGLAPCTACSAAGALDGVGAKEGVEWDRTEKLEDQFWVESEYGEKFLEEVELGEER